MNSLRAMFTSAVFVLGLLFTTTPIHAEAQVPLVKIDMLERKDCAHCLAEKAYLEALQKRRTDIVVRLYDIDTPEGGQMFDAVTKKANLVKSTPITIVGGTIISGFDSAETSGKRIEDLIERNRESFIQGFQDFLKSDQTNGNAESVGEVCSGTGEVCASPVAEVPSVDLPWLGTVSHTDWSLPVLAAAIGFFDGFNPCAMWVLVTFLLVLMQLGSKRQMWMVVGSFLVAEAGMYYLILNVWLKVWDFVGMDRIVTPMVGILAIGGGLFFLYEWYKSLGTEMACRVVNMEERSKIIRKIKSIATREFSLITFGMIVLLATSVNIIEFACSIGYPQTFTKILELNNLNFFQTQGLMLIYIFFYMVDDFVVFGLALWGFNKIHLTESFSRWSALLGGLLMLFLGWLLIFHSALLRSFS